MAILRRVAMLVLCMAAIQAVCFPSGPARATDAPPVLRGTQGQFVETKIPAPALALTTLDGAPTSLEALKGRLVLVNLWATWCTPCVKEMPSLAALQRTMGGDRFQVAALSLDRGGAKVVRPFLERLGIQDLPVLLDPKGESMKAFRPRGLPTSYLMAPDGTVVGYLEGEADWASPAAQALIRHYLDGTGG